ncbi:MAG TPA: PH domain-containing protein [Verrucomicrobiae bacterium]|nr:PH domain-containing protein [Verrucomicrobiae bacterium]
MYSAFKKLCEDVLRIPPAPQPPPGDEAKTRVFLAAPNYYKYLLVLWALKMAGTVLIFFVLFIAPAIALARGAEKSVAIFLVLEGIAFVFAMIGGLIGLAMVRLDFEKRWYLVTDRSLRVREGIVQMREATVTFANIQNISISQGPIQRVLGIADLRVDTAGGGGGVSTHGQHGTTNMHTVKFRGVNNANEIKELMQQRLRQLKDSGLGDHDDHHAVQPDAVVSSSFLAALREVHAEAQALRVVASRHL